jgi:hypothetical protein
MEYFINYGSPCIFNINVEWGIHMVFETLTSQLTVVLTLGMGALLIALFPILYKANRFFAWFSLAMGIVVWLLLFGLL